VNSSKFVFIIEMFRSGTTLLAQMLNAVFKKYKIENLGSKWSLEIVDRYVCQTENEDLCPNISNYLKSVCETNIKSTSKSICYNEGSVNFE
jgi:hypothetical protein